MAYDALAELRAGGNPVDLMTQAQQDVLAQLSPEEVATLNSVRGRVEAVSGEVIGQNDVVGGVIF